MYDRIMNNFCFIKMVLSILFLFFIANVYAESKESEIANQDISIVSSELVCKKNNNSFFECVAQNWKKVVLRHLLFFFKANLLYLITKSYKEWANNIVLTEREREFIWHDALIFTLIAENCCGDLFCSSKNKDVKDESKVQIESACISQG